MNVKLVISSGRKTGQAVPVRGGRFFIGRAEDCHLRPNTDLVSRHHCVITVADDLVTIRDLGSRNGTFVNAERIGGEEELKNGDRIAIGPLKFEVALSVDAAGQKKSAKQNVAAAAAHTAAAGGQSDGEDGDELDLSDLLAAKASAVQDTRKVDQTAAGTVTFAEDEGATSGQTPPDSPTAEESPQTDGKKTRTDKAKKPGTRPCRMSKPKAADSQAAAADTLRHFFHRK